MVAPQALQVSRPARSCPVQAPAARPSRGSGARPACRALPLLLLVTVVACWPRAAPAGLWSAEALAAYGLEAEFQELRATRERIARDRALRRDLWRTAAELEREILTVRRRGERAQAELAAQGDAIRRQERALDRIVPRLVARQRALEQRRGQAARALADLASLSRRQQLEPELRGRLRTVAPVLLAVLRDHDATSTALARQRDRLVEQQLRLAARAPILRAEIERLRVRHDDMVRWRRSALHRLAALDAELRRLGRAAAALARPMLVVEAAQRARVDPDAAQPARDLARSVLVGDAVRGRARAGGVAQASRSDAARAVTIAAAARPPASWQLRLAPTLAVRQPLPRVARPGALRPDTLLLAWEAGGALAAPARPVSIAMSVAGLSSRVAPARLPAPAPIRPTRAVVAHLDAHGADTAITIAALPGQRVAAPQDGRVVFADAFKSYGLLLIIEHDREYHTLLWGFSKLRVAVGDEVRSGEIVGVMDVVDGVAPQLGVELRRRGRPVDPSPWLAGSSSKVRG
jgi:murein hydrolase activator